MGILYLNLTSLFYTVGDETYNLNMFLPQLLYHS